MSETTYYKYISNGAHYTDVIAKIANVKHHLWIGTVDIKDLYVKKQFHDRSLSQSHLSIN